MDGLNEAKIHCYLCGTTRVALAAQMNLHFPKGNIACFSTKTNMQMRAKTIQININH